MTDDITIIGAGLLGTWHLSRAGEDAVRSARVVFYSAYNTGMVEHVRTLNASAEVRSSDENEYAVGMYRPDMYRRMARVVLDAASAGPGVVVLAPGSAVVVDLVTQHSSMARAMRDYECGSCRGSHRSSRCSPRSDTTSRVG